RGYRRRVPARADVQKEPTAMTQPPPGPPPSPLAPSPGVPPSSGTGAPGGPNLVNGSTTHGLMGRKGIRHPWEMPLLWVGIALTTLAYIVWWVLILSTLVLQVTEGEATVASLWQYVAILPFSIQMAVVLPLAPPIIWWARAMMYAQLRTTAVRMSPTQFPEAYLMAVEAAHHFRMPRGPDAYVVMGTGVVSAFAAGHGVRRFVAVRPDLSEVGGAARDPEALRLVIGHEVGHHPDGDVSYFRLVFTTVIRM